MSTEIKVLKESIEDYKKEVNKRASALIHQCHKYIEDIKLRAEQFNEKIEEWENKINSLDMKLIIIENIISAGDGKFLETPIENAKFSTRTFNALNCGGMLTLKDVFILTPSDLRLFRNLGAGAIEEINKKFLSHDIKWK